jgi:hypothetical protein
MVQGIDHDDPLEASIREGELRRIGSDEVKAPFFFSSLSEHAGGEVGNHILSDQGAKGHRYPAGSTTRIEQTAAYWKLK